MAPEPNLIFKVADQPWEFERSHRLNYKTFVEEIPQHSPNPRKALIDQLLAKSICFGVRTLRATLGHGYRPLPGNASHL